MPGQLWWRYQEGIFLIGTLVISSMAVEYCRWPYQQTMPVQHPMPACSMNVTILLVMLVLVLYTLPFVGWQILLVRRRLAGKPITAWGVVAFLGNLLPIFCLGYIALTV